MASVGKQVMDGALQVIRILSLLNLSITLVNRSKRPYEQTVINSKNHFMEMDTLLTSEALRDF